MSRFSNKFNDVEKGIKKIFGFTKDLVVRIFRGLVCFGMKGMS